MNKELKILVCDRNQTFFRFFKKRFPEFNFSYFSYVKKDLFLFNEFDGIIFIQEDPIKQYMPFFRQFEQNSSIIFGISKRKPLSDLDQIDEKKDMLLYMLETKFEISDQLGKHFDNLVLKNK